MARGNGTLLTLPANPIRAATARGYTPTFTAKKATSAMPATGTGGLDGRCHRPISHLPQNGPRSPSICLVDEPLATDRVPVEIALPEGGFGRLSLDIRSGRFVGGADHPCVLIQIGHVFQALIFLIHH
jgi:hypothetical protein